MCGHKSDLKRKVCFFFWFFLLFQIYCINQFVYFCTDFLLLLSVSGGVASKGGMALVALASIGFSVNFVAERGVAYLSINHSEGGVASMIVSLIEGDVVFVSVNHGKKWSGLRDCQSHHIL